ncbi:MAG: hypothetical protein AB7K09_07950 [Planctomycetota bacterium]
MNGNGNCNGEAASPRVAATRVAIALLVLLPWVAGCSQGPGTPQGVVSALQSAAASRDYGAVWDLLSPPTQARVEISLQRVAERLGSDQESQQVFGSTVERVRSMSGRQRFVALLRSGNSEPRIVEDAKLLKDVEVVGEPQVDGDKATIVLRHADQERTLQLVKLGGSWRIDGTAACGASASGRADLAWLAVLLLGLAVWRRRNRVRAGQYSTRSGLSRQSAKACSA